MQAEDQNEAIAEQVRRAQVNYIDETAWYQHGVLAWRWVMVHPTVALSADEPEQNGL